MKRILLPTVTSHFVSLALAGMLSLGIAGSGCKLKKNQVAEAAAQAKTDQGLTDAQRAQAQADATAAALEAAKQKLRSRISLYNALSGDYIGTYTGNGQAIVEARVHVYSGNVPAPAELEQMSREEEVRSRADSITLNVRTDEVTSADHHHAFSCEGQGLKPDFAQGLVRFECTGQGSSSGRRSYVLGFDSGDLRAMANETPETAQTISSEIGNDLVAGQQTSLGGFRLVISVSSDFTYRFEGALSRRASR